MTRNTAAGGIIFNSVKGFYVIFHYLLILCAKCNSYFAIT